MSLTTTNFLGPLTTIFTPPSACLSTVTYNPSAIWAPDVSKSGGLSPAVLLGATGQAIDLVCYPPQYTVDRIYSPGICPSGWTSACEPTSDFGDIIISHPTSAVQCCPAGFQCSQALWCVQGPTATERPAWSLWTDKWGIEGKMTMASFPTNKVMAKPIFVAYQSTDEALLAEATRTSIASSGAGQKSLDQTQSQQSDPLSAGTIAGIAIGSAAGGVVLATIATFLMLRFCFGYRKTHGRGADDTIQLHTSEVDGAARYEMDNAGKGPYPRPPASQQSMQSTSNELPTEAARVELAGGWKGG